MVSGKAVMLPISDEAFENLKKINQWIQRRTIPANLYTNQDYDVLTAGDPADLIVCRDELPEELAYNMAKALYESVDNIRAVAAALTVWPRTCRARGQDDDPIPRSSPVFQGSRSPEISTVMV